MSNDPRELERLFEAAIESAPARAELAKTIFPTAQTLDLGLVPHAGDAKLALAQAYDAQRPPPGSPDRAWARILKVPRDRTQVTAHQARAADLIAAVPRSIATTEFPGGAQTIAPLLNPALDFYELTAVAPGASSGTRFHLLFWAGHHWTMLGPAWRWLPERA